jgi:hypothetical protein
MERRKAVTVAAATSLTLLAGAGGIALNSGIVRAEGDDNVGQLSPLGSGMPVVTVYVDDPALAGLVQVPAVRASDGTPVSRSAASGRGDDEWDDDEWDDDDHDDDDHDDDDHDDDDDDDDHDDDDDDDHEEYEGGEDDD